MDTELLLAAKCRVLIGPYLELFSVWTSREREVDDLVYVHCFHLKHQVVHRSAENLRLAELGKVSEYCAAVETVAMSRAL